jgi:hypothetical protein
MLSALKNSLPFTLALCVIISSCSDGKSTKTTVNPVNIQPPGEVQEKKRAANLDKSPMDVAYYPEEFPVLKMSGKIGGEPIARIIYSRPSKDGRNIFGNVVKYGTYWRLGANESSEIEFFRDVKLMGKTVRKGRYIIYCVPYEKKWTIKLNSDLYTWGLSVHTAKDVYSFDVPTNASANDFDVLTMRFEPIKNGAQLLIAWDNVITYLPFSF